MRKILLALLFTFMLAIAMLPASVAQADCPGHCSCAHVYEWQGECGDHPYDDFHRYIEYTYVWFRSCTEWKYCCTSQSDHCRQDSSCGGIQDIGDCGIPIADPTIDQEMDTAGRSVVQELLTRGAQHVFTVELPDDVVIGNDALQAIKEALHDASTAEDARGILRDSSLQFAGDITVYDPE